MAKEQNPEAMVVVLVFTPKSYLKGKLYCHIFLLHNKASTP
jgi:hypothetical protein